MVREATAISASCNKGPPEAKSSNLPGCSGTQLNSLPLCTSPVCNPVSYPLFLASTKWEKGATFSTQKIRLFHLSPKNVPWRGRRALAENGGYSEPKRVLEAVVRGGGRGVSPPLDKEEDDGHGEEGEQGRGPDASLHRFHEREGSWHRYLRLLYHDAYPNLHKVH